MSRTLALLIVLVAHTAARAGDLEVGADPQTGRKYFFDGHSDREAPVAIAWTFEPAAAASIDFDRGVTDQKYLNDKVDEGTSVLDVLVDTKTGRVIADLSGEKASYQACFSTGETSANHCELAVHYNARARLAIVTLDAKWSTTYVGLYRLVDGKHGLELQSSASALPIITADVKRRLERAHGKEPRYRAARKSLVFTFGIAGSKLVREDGKGAEVALTVVANGGVPKDDDAFALVDYRLRYRIRADAAHLVIEPR